MQQAIVNDAGHSNSRETDPTAGPVEPLGNVISSGSA